MTFRENLDPIADGETLARFVVHKREIRSSDQSVRLEVFVPHPRQVLSVTRHIGLTDNELWSLGGDVAAKRELALYGRADIATSDVRLRRLEVEPTVFPPNHANVTGWPPDKPAQKRIAQELAIRARFVPTSLR